MCFAKGSLSVEECCFQVLFVVVMYCSLISKSDIPLRERYVTNAFESYFISIGNSGRVKHGRQISEGLAMKPFRNDRLE